MVFIINWIRQIRSAFHRYQRVSNWLAILILIFSFTDIIDGIPFFRSMSIHPAFLFFSEIDDLVVIGLILFVAYRWNLALGQGGIILYALLHISYYFLGYMAENDLPIRVGSIGFISIVGIWLISRLRKTEIDLRTSEEMFRTMSDSSPIGIYIVQDGKFRYTNPQFRNYTGYREGELIDTDSLNLVVGEDRDLVRVNAIKMLKGQEAVPYEYRVTTKNGQIKWIMETVVSVRYHEKKATLGNFIDITGRKKIEAELKERNIQMTALQQVSRVINQSLEMKMVANLALEESLKILNLDCGAIRYLDEDTQEIVLLAHKGLTPEMVTEMQTRPRVKVGHGPMGELVKTGEPLIIQDIPSYPKFEYESTRNSGFQSYLGVPLKINGKVVGTMTGLSRQRRTFTKIDMEMLSSLGNMIGVAISNARFYSDLCRRTTELTALLTIEKGLAGDIPIQRALGGALIILADGIGADMGTIHLFNNKNKLELVAHHCLSPELLELARKDILHHGILEEAIERHVPVTIDVSKYPGILNGAAPLTKSIRILACAPVIIGERVLGVINVARKQSSLFNEQELELLQSVSSQIAVSYERAKLVDELNLRLERREARARIAAAISSSLDMETIFRSLKAELPSLVQFAHFAVALFKGNTLEISTISEEYGGLFPRGMVVSAEDEMLYKVVQEGKPTIRNDIEKEIAQPLDNKLLAVGIHSTLLIPLNAGGHTFGTLILASREIGKFSETDFQSLKPIADQLAVAVDNSRLFMQIESAAGEWRRTFDTMSDGVAIIGTDFRIKRTNMALARLLGTSPQDLMDRYWYEAVYGTSGPPSDCPIRVCIAEKKTFDREWQEPNLNNRWLHMRGDPILGTNGQVLSVVQTLRDITGEKQRQKNLESLYRLSQSLSTSLNLDTVINLALDEIIPIIGKSNA
ncbi:MAG: putative PAS/PAC sensor protein, partial [Dehalococcoidia bacterium]|nr:putative PAS/PAC sensor protein [Dehalococcoidia bacterium]